MLSADSLENNPPLKHPSRKFGTAIEGVGVVGLYLFAVSAMASVSIANIGLGLMLIGFILSPNAWKAVRKEPIFWLCIILIVYVILRAVWAGHEFPSTSDLQLKRAKSWILLFLFFVVSWWLSLAPKHTPVVLILTLTGFSVGILASSDAPLMMSLVLESTRSGMHYGRPIIFGFHCAVILLGVLLFAPRWLHCDSRHSRWTCFTLYVLTLFLVLFFLRGMIISQSRGVWLAAVIVIPTASILFYRKNVFQGSIKNRRWIMWLFVAAILTLAAAPNLSLIYERISLQSRSLNIIVEQGLENAPRDGVGHRLHMWRFGIEKWSEHPFIGWGPGSTQFLVGKETTAALFNPKDGKPWDHLHSLYVELLLQLGLIGAVLVVAIVALLVKSTLDANKERRLPNDLLFFFISCIALIAIYSLTDFRHLQWNWRFFWLLLAGIGFSSRINPASR